MVNKYNRLSHEPTISEKMIYATDTHANHFIFTGRIKNKRIWCSGAMVAAAKKSVDANLVVL